VAKETTNGKPGAGVNDFPFVTLEERKLWGQASLTPRVYAAIHLRIPDSGIDWLDKMIAKAERRDIAAKIAQGLCPDRTLTWTCIAQDAHELADAIIAERAKGE